MPSFAGSEHSFAAKSTPSCRRPSRGRGRGDHRPPPGREHRIRRPAGQQVPPQSIKTIAGDMKRN